MELQGQITIARVQGDDDTPIHIEIVDKGSGCRLLDVKMSLKNFAEALTSLAYRPCKLRYHEGCPVGKTREVKDELVSLPRGATKEQIRAALSAYEVDGWKGSDYDAAKHHNRYGTSDDLKVKVGFIRYV